MKAEELMIGDLVRIIDDDTDAFFDARVEGIDSLANIYATMPCDETAYPYSVDCAKPIPLTPEILEKNGFVYNDLPFVQAWEQFGLALYSGGNGYRIGCGNNVALIIDSVHELQHAIRLAGIDKEITL